MKMEAKTVDVERGWGWFMDGWGMFMKNPVVWILMMLIVYLIIFLLSNVPILNILISGLLGTMLAGGLIYSASQLDKNGKLEIQHLFRAFLDDTKIGPMLILGFVTLIASLIMGVVTKGLIGSINFQFGTSMIIGILLLLLLIALLVSLLFYAIPQVMLRDIAPIYAIPSGVMGALRNWQPLLVFCLIYLLLGFIASIPVWLGFLILGPVTAGAWYQSYKDLFQD
jgi:uncharacterized membrane protein